MTVVVYDIETLSNFFLYCDEDAKTDRGNIFIIHRSRNDLIKFIDYLERIDIAQVGYNVLGFDAQVLQWILNNKRHLLTLDGDTCAREIYKYSQSVINKQNNGEWLDFPEWKIKIPQLDLFKIWHYDNRAKITGLKWIQFSIDWENLQEMPLEHYDEVNEDQIDDIISYCQNDVKSTKAFYYITLGHTNHPLYKGINKIALRKDIENQFGIKCKNFNDVKIGDEINKQSYLNITGLTKEDLKQRKALITSFKYKDCIPDYVKFQTPELISFFNNIKETVVNPASKQEFPIKFKGTKYVIAKGGIHSEDPKRILIPTSDQILRDADIGSQYPNGIRKRKLHPRHLGPEWLEGYIGNIVKRLEAKARYKKTKNPGDKAIDEAFKLALNGGGFGKTGEPTSWQYDPFVSMSVTIGNQFEILMLIEMLELKGIHVVSANTDGIVCLFDKSKEEEYYKICKEWETIVGNNDLGQLEYTDYEFYAQTSVNSYIAIKSGTGNISDRVKTKNEFVFDFEIHKDKSSRVVPLALYEYFVNKNDPKEFILNHKNIYDFCIGVKKKGDWFFESETIINGQHVVKKEQKTLRYYVSNRGCKIIKRNPDGRSIQVEAGKWMQTLFNKYEKKPWEEYDINYQYYIDKTYGIINSMEGNSSSEVSSTGQLGLF
jgi:hypothetical protein